MAGEMACSCGFDRPATAKYAFVFEPLDLVQMTGVGCVGIHWTEAHMRNRYPRGASQ